MSSPQQLRQKAIGVLYVISLLLFFLFYSIDYSDGLALADRRIRQQQKCVDSIFSIATAGLLADTVLIPGSASHEELWKFEHLYRSIDISIDSARTVLQNNSGFNAFGYLIRGSSRGPGKELLLRAGFFDSLLRRVRMLHSMVAKADPRSVSPGDSTVVDSKGKTVGAAAFYFDHSPLNAAMLYLTSFKSSLMLDRLRYFRAIYGDGQPGSVRKDLAVSRHDMDSLAGKDSVKPAPAPSEGGNAALVHKPALRRAGQVATAALPDPVRVTAGSVVAPVLVPDGSQTIYVGQDNKFLMIGLPPTLTRDKIHYTATADAQVITRDSNVFIRPLKSGKLVVRAFAGTDNDDGRLLYQKDFIAKELSLPAAFLRFAGEDGESTIEGMHKNSALLARSGEPTIIEDIYVAGFDLFIIPDASRQFSVYLHNDGGSFSGLVSRALARLKPGNIIVFTNIATKSTQGVQRQAQPLIVKIK